MNQVGDLFSGVAKRMTRRAALSLHNSFNDVASVVLENGLKADIKDRIESEMLNVSVSFGSGSNSDPVNKTGVAHLLEHMAFSQNVEFMEGLRRDFELKGGTLNGGTNYFGTFYSLKIPDSKSNRRLLHEVASQMIFNLEIDPDQLEEEKKVVINEIGRVEDQAKGSMSYQVLKTAFGQENLINQVIGTAESVQSINVEDLKKYHAEHYIASNCRFSISGPASFSKVLNELKNNYGKLEAEPLPERPERDLTKNSDYVGGSLFIPGDEKQTYISGAFSLPNTDDDKLNATGDLLKEYIFLSMKNEFRGTRNRRLYACDAHWANYQSQKIIVLSADIMPEDAGTYLPGVAKIINNIAEGKIDSDLFEVAIAKSRSGLSEFKDKSSSNSMNFVNPDDQEARVNNLKSIVSEIKPEDLTRLVNKEMLSRPPTLFAGGDTSNVQGFDEFNSMLNDPSQESPKNKTGFWERIGIT